MLFKPDLKSDLRSDLDETAKADRERGAPVAWRGRRTVVIAIMLLVVGGLGYLGWTSIEEKQAANRARPNQAVPVLAATPHIKDVPVYLDGVGAVRALNNVLVRPQVDGKLISINFVEGQDVKKGDVLGEIDPVIYKAQLDQAVAKKAQDEALLANQRLDLIRYQQLAAANAGSKQQYDTQRAVIAQQEALVEADQAAIDNARATLGYTRIIAPISGRTGLRQVDQGNIVHASDATGVAVITQLRPIAVLFSLPQQQIVRVNAASAKGALTVDVFGNDGTTVVDTGKLAGIDNQVDPTTGTLKLKAEFPNDKLQLWPGQFVNVRLRIETLSQAMVIPTSAVQRGPTGTFSYVIGENDTVTAKPVTVTQQSETEAVIADGLSTSDRVVTTGFASLSDGAKVSVGKDEPLPVADIAPHRRNRGGRGGRDGSEGGRGREARDAREGQPSKDWQSERGEHRGRRGEHRQGDGDQKGQAGLVQGSEPPVSTAKPQR
ncbi:efflux RND transporter periplasmic adaptor subunit [Bradyrhizobium sp.]|jgi:multidrug efflux system membrane fusion protein|uniref:efflux RND transporter periplasmic adaptor subunit n=1 Tax=Bradyrhizobium sp. TaxID=376 RepID=UPI003C6AA868